MRNKTFLEFHAWLLVDTNFASACLRVLLIHSYTNM
jgi:hypothetical protein